MKCDICGHKMKYDPLTRSWECSVCFNLDKKSSEVEHPKHYVEGRKFEPIDVIEDWNLGFNLGNAVKYISRAGRKDDVITDLEKAQWYLDREITKLKLNRTHQNILIQENNL